jgi:hypothetical protein
MTNVIGHGYNSFIVIIFRVLGCLTAPLTAFMSRDDPVWSQLLFCFGHSLLYATLAADVAANLVADVAGPLFITNCPSFWSHFLPHFGHKLSFIEPRGLI